MLVLVAATLNDLLPWLIFSVVLGNRSGGHSLICMLALTVGFVALIMTLGRWVADRALPSLLAHLAWPEDDFGFLLVTGLVGTTNTVLIDIHAIFGAFLSGIVRCGSIE